MRTDAPKDIPTHLLENPDKYITRIGRFLRKTSLDELPQIFNILSGKMSIVGPRPALWNQFDLVEERDKYGANVLRPGLTGWAQVNGRDELPIAVKSKFDGEYARKIGLFFDIKILFKTVFRVFKSEGVREGKCEDNNVSITALQADTTAPTDAVAPTDTVAPTETSEITNSENTETSGTIYTDIENTETSGTISTDIENTETSGTISTDIENTETSETISTDIENTETSGTISTDIENTETSETINTDIENAETSEAQALNLESENAEAKGKQAPDIENVNAETVVKETGADSIEDEPKAEAAATFDGRKLEEIAKAGQKLSDIIEEAG